MMNLTNISSGSLSVGAASSALIPLVIFIAGIVAYSIFIFKFYRFLARKDIFKLNLQQYSKSFLGFLEKIFNVILYIIEYLLLFPVFIFFWFGVISFILIALSNNPDVSRILIVAMALVTSVRITAYYNEDLSKDLAKMFPFALLAVFLLDITSFSYSNLLLQLKIMPSYLDRMLYYLAFTILLEFVLRITYGISRLFVKGKNKEG